MSDCGSYFYRCYSQTSAGGLISGKGSGQGRPLGDNLLAEFINHLNLHTTYPTALVSVSSRIIDTLRRAFNKFYEDREDPSQIWIAFIYVPNADKHVRYHHAEGLARKGKMEKPSRLRYEYLFEWGIPEEYFFYRVSVETLMKRGFNMSEFLVYNDSGVAALPSTRKLRNDFARAILESSDDAHEVGIYLGLLARSFGARSPLRQITLQLQLDCYHNTVVDYEAQFFSVSYDDGLSSVFLDFEYFCAIEDGVEEALCDWWLTEPGFNSACNDHQAWATQIRRNFETDWEPVEIEMQIEEAAIELGL